MQEPVSHARPVPAAGVSASAPGACCAHGGPCGSGVILRGFRGSALQTGVVATFRFSSVPRVLESLSSLAEMKQTLDGVRALSAPGRPSPAPDPHGVGPGLLGLRCPGALDRKDGARGRGSRRPSSRSQGLGLLCPQGTSSGKCLPPRCGALPAEGGVTRVRRGVGSPPSSSSVSPGKLLVSVLPAPRSALGDARASCSRSRDSELATGPATRSARAFGWPRQTPVSAGPRGRRGKR